MTDHKAWCSTLVDNTGKHVGGQGKWGTCGPGCPIPPDDSNFLQVRLQGGSKPNEGFIEIKPSNDGEVFVMTFLKNPKQMSFVEWLDILMELKKFGQGNILNH